MAKQLTDSLVNQIARFQTGLQKRTRETRVLSEDERDELTRRLKQARLLTGQHETSVIMGKPLTDLMLEFLGEITS